MPQLIESLEEHLHSTMLLLYRKNASNHPKEACIYIPLCFYFIASGLGLPPLPMWFTFHYASTLSTSSVRVVSDMFAFTFHYASTLSMSRTRLVGTKSTFTFHYASTLSRIPGRINYESYIYIPLCFYFIFHDLNIPTDYIFIYIPLCFYFILYFHLWQKHEKLIYIPLCFYFIPALLRGDIAEW